MGTHEVRLERAAVEGLADLAKSGDADKVLKRIERLEDNPEQQGEPLGNKFNINLTGCRKLTMLNRRVRIVYRVKGQVVQVVVVGKREDLEVYHLAQAEIERLRRS
jgi:mRNA interferase RelE/StbE